MIRCSPSKPRLCIARALVIPLLLSLLGCASLNHPVGVSPQAARTLDRAVAERSADPSNPAKATAVVRAALDAQRYPLAFEAAQTLRELDPEGAEPLYLLGRACQGLGLFDEAMASYFASVQKTPTEDATYQLTYLLVAKGRSDLALDVLNDATQALPNIWRLEKLKSEVMPTLEDRVSVLEYFLSQSPGHAEASALLEALKPPTPVQHYLKISQGANEVIRSKLNDSYTFSLDIMGKQVYTYLTFGGRYLTLSEKAARDCGIVGTGIAGPSFGKDWTTELAVVPRIQLGQLVLENVPALIQVGGSRTEVTATLPLTLLDGYVWKLDRKNEVLELYPPSQPVPPPKTTAQVLPYYSLNGRLVTDAVLSNGIGEQTLKGKVSFNTFLPDSVVSVAAVREYQLGQVNSTSTNRRVTFVFGSEEFSRPVFARNVRIHLGGGTFLGSQRNTGFYGADLCGASYFCPAAILGRDVLSRFILTINPNQHTLTLELY